MQNKDEIKPVDLGEAAFLLSLGFKFVRLDSTDKPRQRAFVIRRQVPDSIAPYYKDPFYLLMDYQNNEINESVKLVFNPQLFYVKTCWLKDRLHDPVHGGFEPGE